jgi:homocysteine S-methyltransferase
MTCRDRNLNATKALLLGLSIEGVHNVLLITGDPVPAEDRSEVKSVFNFNSRKLARYVTRLNEQSLRTPFRVFAALDLNARNFEVQLGLALEKEECGVSGFLTQPVLSRQALDNLALARKTLKGKLLGGIYPVVSHRNACFLNNEISGIHVCDEIISLYEGKDRDEAEDLAVTISARVAQAVAPYTDGLYLMTPFQRVSLMERIIEKVR